MVVHANARMCTHCVSCTHGVCVIVFPLEGGPRVEIAAASMQKPYPFRWYRDLRMSGVHANTGCRRVQTCVFVREAVAEL